MEHDPDHAHEKAQHCALRKKEKAMMPRSFGVARAVPLGASLALLGASLALLGAGLAPLAHAQERKALLVAEPTHGIGYLPLYVAIHNGYFAKDGLDVKVMTVDGGPTQ